MCHQDLSVAFCGAFKEVDLVHLIVGLSGVIKASVVCSGADVQQVKRQDAGAVLADTLRQFLSDLHVEDGLGAVGYSKDDIPALVKGTLPQVSALQRTASTCKVVLLWCFISFFFLLRSASLNFLLESTQKRT